MEEKELLFDEPSGLGWVQHEVFRFVLSIEHISSSSRFFFSMDFSSADFDGFCLADGQAFSRGGGLFTYVRQDDICHCRAQL